MNQSDEYIPLHSTLFPSESVRTNSRILSIDARLSGWLITYRRGMNDLIRPKHFTHFSYALRQIHHILCNYKVTTRIEFPYKLCISYNTILPRQWVEILRSGKLTEQDTACEDTLHKECMIFNRYLNSHNKRVTLEHRSMLTNNHDVATKTVLVATPTDEYLQAAAPTILKINKLNDHKI